MSLSKDIQISKFMSLVLRHAPNEAGLTLDENGWTDFNKLCAAIQAKFGTSAAEVVRIIDENPKKRFAIDGDRVRAVQGHSVEIDLGLSPSIPPTVLYHGTKEEFLPSILREGLISQSRQHVHLSKDIETAVIVAQRRKGRSVILRIDSENMAKNGPLFFLSENGVWLTSHVLPRYLFQLNEHEFS
ncbi:RNA 2'-phosphotransferase [Mesorhizobium sp. M0199]|uniref:RNA 2'-phosphotransferase n=1 Tax=unclassified Mesorhizobium TaxID=325217 RepID=UPI0033364B2F